MDARSEIQCDGDEQTESDQTLKDQIESDHQLAQQLEKDTNENKASIDLDYLMALSMEQQDIIDAAALPDDDILDIANDPNECITNSESEIVALLQSGVDIESLIAPNSTLTKEYITALKQTLNLNQKSKDQALNRLHRKSKKRQKKKQRLSSTDNVEHVQNMDAFVKKFTTFPKQKRRKTVKSRNTRNKSQPQRQKPKKKKRKKRKKSQNNAHKQKPAFSEECVCIICATSFESKAALYSHLQRNPRHVVKNASNWLKRRNIPDPSNWIINHKYNENAIVHDRNKIYLYYAKQDRYELIKRYDHESRPNRYDFWLSADLSLFYNATSNHNSSFYLLVLAIDGDEDKVRVCDRIHISELEDDIQVRCNEMDVFLNKVINIDPAETLLTGTDHHVLFILAHSSLHVVCTGSDDPILSDSGEREIESAALEFTFVVYNLRMDKYEERKFILEINTNDINTTYGGDFHLGMVRLDVESFLIFGENVMFRGIYNEALSLDHDACLRFERMDHTIRFGEVIKCGEVYWSFSYLKYGDFIIVLGGMMHMFDPMDDIIIYDIRNTQWFRSDAKLPFPLSSCGSNVFVDNNNWVHYMGGDGTRKNCHYTLPMKQIVILNTEVDCIIHYWIRRDIIIMNVIHGWLSEFNRIIYKYCLS